jgi:hypothetical protein
MLKIIFGPKTVAVIGGWKQINPLILNFVRNMYEDAPRTGLDDVKTR